MTANAVIKIERLTLSPNAHPLCSNIFFRGNDNEQFRYILPCISLAVQFLAQEIVPFVVSTRTRTAKKVSDITATIIIE